MKFFQTIWHDIRAGQNLEVYITIIIAIVVAILGILGVADQAIISAAVLATLALLSVSTLTNRRENENIRNVLSQIDTTRSSAKQFFQEYDRSMVQQLVNRSRKAFFWGLTFTTTIPLLKNEIEQGLQSNLDEVRFLLLKPSSDAVKMTAFRTKDADIKQIEYTLLINLTHLADLDKRTPGKLEVRVIDYLPPWYMVMVDPHLQTGHMFVRLNSFRGPDVMRPTFELTAENDNEFFHFFVKQFQTVWAVSEPVDLNQFARKRN